MPLFEEFPDYGNIRRDPSPPAKSHREQLGCFSEADRMFLQEIYSEHLNDFTLVNRRSGMGNHVTIECEDKVWIGWVKHLLAERERRVHALKSGMRVADRPTQEIRLDSGAYARFPTDRGYVKEEWQL